MTECAARLDSRAPAPACVAPSLQPALLAGLFHPAHTLRLHVLYFCTSVPYAVCQAHSQLDKREAWAACHLSPRSLRCRLGASMSGRRPSPRPRRPTCCCLSSRRCTSCTPASPCCSASGRCVSVCVWGGVGGGAGAGSTAATRRASGQWASFEGLRCPWQLGTVAGVCCLVWCTCRRRRNCCPRVLPPSRRAAAAVAPVRGVCHAERPAPAELQVRGPGVLRCTLGTVLESGGPANTLQVACCASGNETALPASAVQPALRIAAARRLQVPASSLRQPGHPRAALRWHDAGRWVPSPLTQRRLLLASGLEAGRRGVEGGGWGRARACVGASCSQHMHALPPGGCLWSGLWQPRLPTPPCSSSELSRQRDC